MEHQVQRIVYVNDKICANTLWYERHPTDGFPYIKCTARKGVVGTTNVTLYVADQWSKHLPILDDVERAVLRSVCLPSDYFIENGTQTFIGGGQIQANYVPNAQLAASADLHHTSRQLRLLPIGCGRWTYPVVDQKQ